MTSHTWHRRDTNGGEYLERTDGWRAMRYATAKIWTINDPERTATYPAAVLKYKTTGLFSLTVVIRGTMIHASGFLTLDDALDDAIAAIERTPYQEVLPL